MTFPDPDRTKQIHDSLAATRADLASRDAEILATQVAVTAIPAPTGEEAARAAWVARRFEALRLCEVHIDGAGNVIGTRAGRVDGPPVVVCAHLDTVFPREAISPARHEGPRIFAPGIGDNGRGIATLLALAGAIDGVTLITQRPIRFVATTGEEGTGDLRGAKHYFEHNPGTIAAIAIDGTGDERVVHRAVGSLRFRVSFDGPGGHSWSDYGVPNPLHASAGVIVKLTGLPLPSEPRTTLTVARTNSGLSVNAVPQNAWFEVDIRSITDEQLRPLERALRDAVDTTVLEANASRRTGALPLTSRIEVIGNRPAGALAAGHPLVELAMAATRLVGRTPELAEASTDANVPLSRDIPAIAIGCGGLGGDVHSSAEWYDNTDGTRGIARALTIVVAAAGG